MALTASGHLSLSRLRSKLFMGKAQLIAVSSNIVSYLNERLALALIRISQSALCNQQDPGNSYEGRATKNAQIGLKNAIFGGSKTQKSPGMSSLVSISVTPGQNSGHSSRNRQKVARHRGSDKPQKRNERRTCPQFCTRRGPKTQYPPEVWPFWGPQKRYPSPDLHRSCPGPATNAPQSSSISSPLFCNASLTSSRTPRDYHVRA